MLLSAKESFDTQEGVVSDDIIRVVEESAEVNHTQLIGAQDGSYRTHIQLGRLLRSLF